MNNLTGLVHAMAGEARAKWVSGLMAAAFLLLVVPLNLYGQAVSRINGEVTDQGGAVVPEAKVTVTNVDTNVSQTTTTTSAGTYLIIDLIPGTYVVKVEKGGFRSSVTKNVVVVGASNIVGKPMALMLMQRDATVCICHAKTRDLAQFTILADILVVAAGHPNLIVPQMVKTGAVVIDVGINRLADGRLVGDTDFAGLLPKVSHITPVPGGVGPMTVTMLLANTIASAEKLQAHSALERKAMSGAS